MMKHVSPRADLPMAYHPRTNNAMPARVTSPAIRNMTGIYLGTDDANSYPRVRHPIPPLARVRGMSNRVRTPTEDRRHNEPSAFATMKVVPQPKMVELLRYKEERRGFSGNPVKRKQLSIEPGQQQSMLATQLGKLGTDITIWDITRQTQRHFTATTNSGLAHLEYLNTDMPIGPYDGDASTVPLSSAVAHEVHREASMKENRAGGLTDCYKKACKGNIEALQSLLPLKTPRESPSSGQGFRYTGFSIKSYRNPNQLELDLDLSAQSGLPRPRTVLGAMQSGGQRPYVPSPYFHKGSNPPSRAATHRPESTQTSTLIYEEGVSPSRFRTASGVGCLPLSVRRGHQTRSSHLNTTPLGAEVLQGSSYTPSRGLPPAGPRGTSARKSVKSAINIMVDSVVDFPDADMRHTEPGNKMPISVPGTTELESDQASSHNTERKMSAAEIVIGLEDEQGEQKPVEIDEADEALEEEKEPEYHQPKRRVSITERVLKNKNCEQQMQLITEKAESRKNELAELLSEHAQIVQEVVTMVESAGTPSSDKENKTFTPPSSTSDLPPQE